MLDWNDLQYFLAIHRARTLAGAARTLRVEHTTVGRRLTALERELGAKLFVRTPEGYSPTAVGAEILPHAEQVERALLQIERAALAQGDRAEGTVRLTTSESFAALLGGWLAELRERHPLVTVELLAGNERLDLTRREADIAVRFAATDQGSLVCRRVATLGWAPYASERYLATRPLAASGSLAGHDVIGFSESLANVPGALWLAEHGAGANVVLRTASLPAACQAAATGLGVAIVPCFMADAESTLVRLPHGIVGARDAFLVVHPDLARVARVRVVLAFLVDRFAAHAAHLTGEATPKGALASTPPVAAPPQPRKASRRPPAR